jgi:RNA recognition motif-containing protein
MKDHGYVCFKNPEHAALAIQTMNKKLLPDGRVLLVMYFISKKDNEISKGGHRQLDAVVQSQNNTYNSNIYIKSIPTNVTEEQLREKFGFKDANILSVKLTPIVGGTV